MIVMIRSFFISALAAGLLLAAGAQAASWPTLPAACVPERAVKWDNGKSANAQSACHCPPASLCPRTYTEYSNPALSKMPMQLVARCCPSIEPAQCPAGSYYAGQRVPADGNCNPELCPAGTRHAGQPRSSVPGNDCAVCPNGNCNPPPEECPVKFYPSLTESATTNANPGSSYTYQDGSSYKFQNIVGTDTEDLGYVYQWIVALSSRYNFTLMRDGLNQTMVNGRAATGTWDWGMNSRADCNRYFDGFCPNLDFYSPKTSGVNNGIATAQQVINSIGAANLTWYGISLVKHEMLANNLISENLMAEWRGRDRVLLGGRGFQQQRRSGNTLYTASGYAAVDTGSRMETENRAFLQECRAAAGEYAELEFKRVGSKQCAYLQCRYIQEYTNSSCLAADTKVTMADGSQKLVTELKIGDLVKGSGGDHKITASNIYQSSLRVLYGINGSGAMLTGDHPIKTTEGWKVITDDAAALYANKPGFAKSKLAIGDTLVTENGEVKVLEIRRFPKVEPVSTYNIRIDNNAGFFANGIEVKGFDKMEMKYE